MKSKEEDVIKHYFYLSIVALPLFVIQGGSVHAKAISKLSAVFGGQYGPIQVKAAALQ